MRVDLLFYCSVLSCALIYYVRYVSMYVYVLHCFKIQNGEVRTTTT